MTIKTTAIYLLNTCHEPSTTQVLRTLLTAPWKLSTNLISEMSKPGLREGKELVWAQYHADSKWWA